MPASVSKCPEERCGRLPGHRQAPRLLERCDRRSRARPHQAVRRSGIVAARRKCPLDRSNGLTGHLRRALPAGCRTGGDEPSCRSVTGHHRTAYIALVAQRRSPPGAAVRAAPPTATAIGSRIVGARTVPGVALDGFSDQRSAHIIVGHRAVGGRGYDDTWRRRDPRRCDPRRDRSRCSRSRGGTVAVVRLRPRVTALGVEATRMSLDMDRGGDRQQCDGEQRSDHDEAPSDRRSSSKFVPHGRLLFKTLTNAWCEIGRRPPSAQGSLIGASMKAKASVVPIAPSKAVRRVAGHPSS